MRHASLNKEKYHLSQYVYTAQTGMPYFLSCGSHRDRKLVLRFSTGVYGRGAAVW